MCLFMKNQANFWRVILVDAWTFSGNSTTHWPSSAWRDPVSTLIIWHMLSGCG